MRYTEVRAILEEQNIGAKFKDSLIIIPYTALTDINPYVVVQEKFNSRKPKIPVKDLPKFNSNHAKIAFSVPTEIDGNINNEQARLLRRTYGLGFKVT